MKITVKRVGLAVAGIVGAVIVGSVALDPATYQDPAAAPTGKPAEEWTVRPPLAKPAVTPKIPVKPAALTVVSVTDGDTFKLSDGRTVRQIGIDTPETVHPSKPVGCYGPEASAFAKTMLEGKTVRVETDPTQGVKDKYGRSLGYVFVGAINYGQYAIGQGMAEEFTYSKPYRYQTLYRNAQKAAQLKRNGLWDACPVEASAKPVKAPSGVFYKNCAAARAAGAAPIQRGEPGYRAGLDRNSDGVACE